MSSLKSQATIHSAAIPLILMLLIVALSPSRSYATFDEQIGFFCPSCTDQQSAYQQAFLRAPDAECDYGNPPQLPPTSCTTVTRRVILGNPISRQKFSLLVTNDGMLGIQVESDSLSQLESEAMDRIFDLRELVESSLFEMSIDDLNMPEGMNQSLAKFGDSTLGSTSGCPSGTAMDAVMNPVTLGTLKQRVRDAVGSELEDSGFITWNPTHTLNGVGVSAFGFGLTLNWEVQDGKTAPLSVRFPLNEEGNSITDIVTFEATLLGVSDGRANMPMTLNEGGTTVGGGKNLADLKKGQIVVATVCD